MDSLRIFAGIVFAVSVFLLVEAWMNQHRAPAPTAPPGSQTIPSAPTTTLPGQPATSTPQAPPRGEVAASATSPAPPILVSTDLLKAEIDPQGGVLRRLELLAHRDTLDKSRNFLLLEQSGNRTYVAQSGLIGEGLPNHTTRYRSSQQNYELQPGEDRVVVPLVADSPSGPVRQTYTFHRDSYVIDVDYELQNKSGAVLRPHAYYQLVRDGNPPPGDSKMVPTYTGAAVYTDSSKYKKVAFADIDKGKVDYPKQADNGWVGLVQHYFVSAWLPADKSAREFFTRALGGGLYAVGVIVPVAEVAPGAVGKTGVRLYAGPQEQDKLAKLAAGLNLTVDYGWLTVIAAPLFWVLSAIYKWVGNWGVAIIILTVIIKILFYPLSAASYKSMAKMRVLAPKLQKLKETHGEDRQRMHQAMVELYKTEKINPLGGCLPIVVQIPVFIALYWVLLGSVELRHAPFMLWITDLSAKDPYYVLPILMGLSMIVQTWMNPEPPDPVQAKVMKIMPIVFSVFFFFFPAGLVLYWLVNNLLSIAQQWSITRAMERAKPANGPR
jgi:YidC/Oxa1 family membrane protein insertase